MNALVDKGADGAMKSGSNLERVLRSGHFAVTAEVGPPQSASSKGVIKHTKHMKDYCDAVNLTDNQTAVVRLSSIAAAVHVINSGAEPVIQMTCRDRNRIAMQSDLLGAYSLGARNILCLSGDHQSFGNHPTAKNVHDIDSIQLVKMIKDMRDEKRFVCGDDIKANEPRFFIGAAANRFADPFEFRVVRLAKKVNAGADFIQTQAVYDLERFEEWMKAVREAGLHEKTHILAGVIPPKSAGALRYMKKVPGMMIPDHLIERMKKAEDPKEEGVKLCVEIIEALKGIEGVSGVHIMAIMWEDIVPEVVERAGLYPRPEVAAGEQTA